MFEIYVKKRRMFERQLKLSLTIESPNQSWPATDQCFKFLQTSQEKVEYFYVLRNVFFCHVNYLVF